MVAQAKKTEDYSFAALTRMHFGEVLSVDEVFARLQDVEINSDDQMQLRGPVWVGSVGYEKHPDHRAFARCLRAAGVERLIDVRRLPISRRRGYAKRSLAQAMTDAGIDYIHIKALGNPKRFRDLYKAGQVEEGRQRYQEYLLAEQADALNDLVPLLSDKRSALMCVEHDAATCHRTVILDALKDELGVELEVLQIT